MVVIVRYLQLSMQSVHITTNVVSSNPVHGEVHSIQLCDKVCQWLAAGRWFIPGTSVSSTNKTDHHNITEVLLKVALNIITLHRKLKIEQHKHDKNHRLH